jgi:hypothetical protein
MPRQRYVLLFRFGVGLMMITVVSGTCLGQPATQPAPSNVGRVLDLADPEVAELKKLDPGTVDLDKVDIKTKTAAIIALNNFLAKHGERARKRVVLLEDYIAARGLSDEFSQDSFVLPDNPPPSLEDGLKVAVLVVQMPEGKEAFGSQVKDTKPEQLQRIYTSYFALCRKDWGEVAYRRFRVTELASFLDRKGLLNDFVSWSRDEAAARKQTQDQINAQIMAERQAEEEKIRAQRMERKRQQEDRQWEMTLRRLDYAERRDRDRDYYRYSD